MFLHDSLTYLHLVFLDMFINMLCPYQINTME